MSAAEQTFHAEDFRGAPASYPEVDALRARMLRHGWQPIRVGTRSKKPVDPKWQAADGLTPPAEPYALNTGVLCAGLRAVDIDIDDPVAVVKVRKIIEEHAGPTNLVRTRGDSSRVLLVYRAPSVNKPDKRIINLGEMGKVEILGNGQQFVAFGTHPDGAEYQWHDGAPDTVFLEQAPAMTEQAEMGVEKALKASFPPTASAKAEPPPPPPRGERKERGDSFFDRVNDAAMANLVAWVPALFPTARKYQDGYRVSSADLGRDLEEDLSILPQGIVDWGVADQGDPQEGKRTPIDLVLEWHDLGLFPDACKAASWLCERLGRKPEEFGWETAERSGEADGPARAGTNAPPVLTQDMLALVFAEQHAGGLRYCHDTGGWFVWDGNVWKRDRTARAFQYSREIARSAAEGGSKNELKEAGKVSFAGGVEKFAQSDPRLAVTVEAWGQGQVPPRNAWRDRGFEDRAAAAERAQRRHNQADRLRSGRDGGLPAVPPVSQ